jgi:hypothetical protein
LRADSRRARDARPCVEYDVLDEECAMRKTLLTLFLAAAGATGLAGSTPASAQSGRIYVDLGDVTFSYGRPYWRHNHEPLYVVYERGYPRYYRYSRPYYSSYYGDGYYGPSVYVNYDRYDYRYDRRHRHDRYYDRYNRYDRRDRDRDWRRDRW